MRLHYRFFIKTGYGSRSKKYLRLSTADPATLLEYVENYIGYDISQGKRFFPNLMYVKLATDYDKEPVPRSSYPLGRLVHPADQSDTQLILEISNG